MDKINKFLVCADLHLRKDTPRCRKDLDWMSVQEKCLEFIKKKFFELNCDFLYITGDIFNSYSVHPEMERMFIKTFYEIKHKVKIIAGNHDLYYHSLSMIDKGSYGVLRQIFPEGTFHFGAAGTSKEFIEMIHILVWPSKKEKPFNAPGVLPENLFKRFPDTKYILTGDYHKSHITKINKQVLINPGSMTRQTADQKDYKPSIVFVDDEKNIIEKIYLPDNEPIIIDDYLKIEEERSNRIKIFIETLTSKDTNIKLDFKENLNIRFSYMLRLTNNPFFL